MHIPPWQLQYQVNERTYQYLYAISDIKYNEVTGEVLSVSYISVSSLDIMPKEHDYETVEHYKDRILKYGK